MANEALVKAVKDIAAASKAGDAERAYHGYRDLFESEAFAGYRVEDQRQALRLMVMAKGVPPTLTPAMTEAYKSALKHLGNIAALGEPADYELLGVCQVKLGDETSASASFKTGLAIERQRDPQSTLCGALMKRVSMI
ncbi:MAG TPA: hypothetical protein VEQ58_13155 [Polyangiaceae bacterium]|nr:hypothetical protein [Polyangiaceae bacterium]